MCRKICFALLVLVCLIGINLGSQPSLAAGNGQPAIQLLADRVRLSWQLPAISFEPDEAGGTRPFIPGYTASNDPGRYALPTQSHLVVLPADAQPMLHVTAVSQTLMPLPAALAIAPRPEGVLRDASGNVIGGDFAPVMQASPTAVSIISIQEIGRVRGNRLARITFNPLQPLADGTARVTTQVTATITFNAAAANPVAKTAVDSTLSALATQVINPAQLTSPQPTTMQLPQATQSEKAVFIEVAQAGLVAITRQALAAAGFAVDTVNPAKLHLTHNGAPIAMQWVGDGDSSFETGEQLLFFADPVFSRWTAVDTYLLSVQNGDGLRMATAAAAATGLTAGRRFASRQIEQNKLYTPNCYCGALPLLPDGDRWAWDDLRQPGKPDGTYSFNLPTVRSAQTAELTAWFLGFTNIPYTSPDHRVELALNGTPLGSMEWNGRTLAEQTFTIPANVLQQSNQLTVSLPEMPDVELDGVWFDAAQLRYVVGSGSVGNRLLFAGENTPHAYTTQLSSSGTVRVYDVTNPNQPVLLTDLTVEGNQVSFGDSDGGEQHYLVTNQAGVLLPTIRPIRPLRTAATTSADYVIVSHPDFIPALTPLVNWRKGQGLKVAVEDVTAIYDAYSNGRTDPAAIKAYLVDAYAQWTPTYVLLVGDATIDPRQYLANSSGTWLPAMLATVDPWIGEVPSDNQYVTVDGSDSLPDMLIGRFPVNSLAETKAVVDKIVAYEQTPVSGWWNSAVSFVTDNTDLAGNFASHANRLISNYIKPPWDARTTYYTPSQNTVDDVVAAIQQQWALGNGMMVYIGHSSTHQWAGERFFHLDDVANLTNAQRLPVVLELTCLTASFQRPDFATLDEALLRHEQGGAVAVWGATGLGVSTGHEELASGFFQSLIADGNANLGEATLAGKLRLMAKRPTFDELVDTFGLLGDPATPFKMEFVTEYRTFLPVIVE